MRGFRYALAFLTRLPSGAHPPDGVALARAVPWFPVVGALVGGIVAGSYVAGAGLWPPLLAACVAVGVGLLVTGAFHEDGLADAADAFGGRAPADRLRIMKDPTHGTFGVTALGVTLIARIAAIGALTGIEALSVLPAIHALSRSTAVVVMTRVRPAAEGLGADHAGNVTRSQMLGAVAVAGLIGAAGLGKSIGVAVLVCVVVAWVWARLAVRSFGGMTGDVLGATQQCAEIALLLMVVAVR